MSTVPNRFPTQTAPYKVALIGEAPGMMEETQGEPFVGTSGRFLAALLSRAGLSRDACFLGNVSQIRPPNNEIHFFNWDGIEITAGLGQLKDDLRAFDPNIVVLLGNVPLKAAMDPSTVHPLRPGKFRNSVSNWRGSLFQCTHTDSPFFGYKCMAAYHPAYVLRDYSVCQLLSFDLKRAAEEGRTPELVLPQRTYLTAPDIDVIEAFCNDLRTRKLPVSTDIEGGIYGITCISFTNTPNGALVVPFLGQHDGSAFTPQDEVRVWRAISTVLAEPSVPKVLQNSLYEGFVFGWAFHLVIRNIKDDTMLKAWELYCELPKGLDTLCSLFTREPYYKVSHSKEAREERQRNPHAYQEYLIYNGKDSVVTHEVNTSIDRHLDDRARRHYQFNLDLLQPFLYMELRGIRYAVEEAAARRRTIQQKVFESQYRLDGIAEVGIVGKTIEQLRAACTDLMCYKRNTSQIKKDYVETHPRCLELLNKPDITQLTDAERGELSVLLDLDMNIKSDRFKKFLYEKLRLPLQTDPKTKAATTDIEALLNISRKTGHPAVKLGIEISRLRTREQMLSISADRDGRIRCGYNVVGSETGRITCYTSPTGLGYNLQTIPNHVKPEDAPGGILGDRDLFLADDGCWQFQCDLAGADGWTVGAHCKALGDSTMLDDYLYGLKPAKILCLMLKHGAAVSSFDREELKERSKEISKDDREYFCCKVAQHGTSYIMGPRKLRDTIFEDSRGKIWLEEREARQFQELFLLRYRGVKLWQQHVSRQLSKKPVMVAASGHRRVFFGRSSDILGEALAFEPQSNTTYATNLACWRLWHDKENRINGKLRIEPLHQVHDALVGQFRKEDTEWATAKIRDYFHNKLTIAGQSIVIPFEGNYGVSWGNLKEGTI